MKEKSDRQLQAMTRSEIIAEHNFFIEQESRAIKRMMRQEKCLQRMISYSDKLERLIKQKAK